MRILISPAKKMNIDTDSLPHQHLPLFLEQSQRILQALQQLDYTQAKALWNCSDAIARPHFERLSKINLHRQLTPAILAYEGIQYTYMAPGVFDVQELAYIQQHLRIMSGFYGLLRPFDGIVPYRLEMQAKLGVDGHSNLYHFWKDHLAAQLAQESEQIVCLASKEYSKAIAPFLPPQVRRTSCVFGEWQGGKIVEKGTLCKMARGEMVRYMAENKVTDTAQLQGFKRLGFAYASAHSTENEIVFIKGED